MQAEHLPCIAAEYVQRIRCEPASTVAGAVDQDADAGAQVDGFELEEVDQSYGAAVECLDDQPQLPCGVEVEALFVEETPERVPRKGRERSADAPHGWVVLPHVEQADVFGFECAQAREFSFERHGSMKKRRPATTEIAFCESPRMNLMFRGR